SVAGDSSTLISPEIANPPVAVAGASLTCSLTSANSVLHCGTYINAKKVDLKPEKFYYDPGSSAGSQNQATWTEIAMTSVDLGEYKAPAPSNLPKSFVVIMRYTDSKTNYIEHLAAQVGVGTLNYQNIVKNGDFESEFPMTGKSEDFLAGSKASTNWSIGTFPESACSKDSILRIQNADAGHFLENGRWASLDSKCALAAGTSPTAPSIMQAIVTKQDNFYFVSFQARLQTEAPNGDIGSTLRVQWGSGGEARSLTFAPTSTSWQTYSYNSTANAELVKLFFIGNAAGNQSAVLFHNIKVYDLGVKP
ncbi:MAG: DUF642 domain-containing protein, partial [Proteobacteria bacterium]